MYVCTVTYIYMYVCMYCNIYIYNYTVSVLFFWGSILPWRLIWSIPLSIVGMLLANISVWFLVIYYIAKIHNVMVMPFCLWILQSVCVCIYIYQYVIWKCHVHCLKTKLLMLTSPILMVMTHDTILDGRLPIVCDSSIPISRNSDPIFFWISNPIFLSITWKLFCILQRPIDLIRIHLNMQLNHIHICVSI